MQKSSTSLRLSADARKLLVALAARLNISQTAVLELAIQELATKWGVTTADVPVVDQQK